jgi:catechol 2,3-dioxygenase-like lactoylglutathione lyase family enzyme
MDASGVSSRRPAAPGRLAHTAVSCILPVKDMARMRRLYEQSLGLEPSGEKPDGKFIYQVGATEIALFRRPEGTRGTQSALRFRVADIAAAVCAIEARRRLRRLRPAGPRDGRARRRARRRQGGLLQRPRRKHPVPARGHRLKANAAWPR